MTERLRICRTPGCMISFDPKYVVQPVGIKDAENLCPKCGMPLDFNPFLKRASDEQVKDVDYET